MEKNKNQCEQKEKPTFKITDKGKNGNSDYPAADKIGSRSSTVARAMASTLMPRIGAVDVERSTMLHLSLDDKDIIKLKKDKIRYKDNQAIITLHLSGLKCVYCGELATNLDHLFPFIKDKLY